MLNTIYGSNEGAAAAFSSSAVTLGVSFISSNCISKSLGPADKLRKGVNWTGYPWLLQGDWWDEWLG